MRAYLDRERARKARAELDRRRKRNTALSRQVAAAARNATGARPVDYLSGEEIHTLWSDGKDYGVFTNTHECWDYCPKVR